eukprot:CAMPEP_0195079924 /NCGR_PEP_ID=MMETSP0448-20130528/21758_1 /TAXON_ID=66468 /ORGANISM="Heterocapsa triquestra, Strain CCMP 448" /LENGTH=191 /DNA_ID=CAMNT_0040112827 /DNA_START=12 /DNA_END=584 /DNA_ORIENTATION=+
MVAHSTSPLGSRKLQPVAGGSPPAQKEAAALSALERHLGLDFLGASDGKRWPLGLSSLAMQDSVPEEFPDSGWIRPVMGNLFVPGVGVPNAGADALSQAATGQRSAGVPRRPSGQAEFVSPPRALLGSAAGEFGLTSGGSQPSSSRKASKRGGGGGGGGMGLNLEDEGRFSASVSGGSLTLPREASSDSGG